MSRLFGLFALILSLSFLVLAWKLPMPGAHDQQSSTHTTLSLEIKTTPATASGGRP